MSYLIDKPEFSAKIYMSIYNHAFDPDKGINGMNMVLMLAGVLVETLMLFDDPDEGLGASFDKLSEMLSCNPSEYFIDAGGLPPSHIIELETEIGRYLAGDFFEDWLNCAYEFHDLLLFVIQNIILQMECEGFPREETFCLLIECAIRCMSYEIAAQELCDIVIERKIGKEGWSLGESVSGLSAIAGRRIALLHNTNNFEPFSSFILPDRLEQVVSVMTREAVRMGVMKGRDWRFSMASNDSVFDTPHHLISSLNPECMRLFRLIGMNDINDQAVSCAKAAGRMLAVATVGDDPELEPAIAKPLAMVAITETYKFVCQEEIIVSC
jgi:hypothetical protein